MIRCTSFREGESEPHLNSPSQKEIEQSDPMSGTEQTRPKPKQRRRATANRPVQQSPATVAPPALPVALSVVIPTRNEGVYLRRTVEQVQATLPDASEIIIVDNGSTDGSARFLYTQRDPRVRLIRQPPLGAAKARNYGAKLAHGAVLVFADAHVDVTRGWWESLLPLLAEPDVGAVAPVLTVMGKPSSKAYGYRLTGPDLGCTWLGRQSAAPHEAPLLGGAFLAIRRPLFEQIGGFDAGMIVWGSEDTELSLRLWLLGYRQLVAPQVEVAHLFRDVHPYTVDWLPVVHNHLRLAFAHFNRARLERVLAQRRQQAVFAAALARLADSDIWERRQQLATARLHDDDWFFDRFAIVC
ncbi:MAG: glycosyltransferase [Caldilineaceae bacterium]